MSSLTLVKSEKFGAVQCDFWQNENGDVFMTIAQLAAALGYADKSGAEKILQRNDYLRSDEFSALVTIPSGGTDKLSVPQQTRVFTEDGIYEVTMLAKTPKAREFRAWVREVVKTIRKTGGYVADDELFIRTYLPHADEQTKMTFRATLALVRKQNEQIAALKPKADYFDALVDRNLLTNFRDTAKELRIRQTDFINWLLEKKFIYRDQKGKLKPYAQFVPELFQLKEWTRNEKADVQTLITPKGRETFRLLYRKNTA